MLKNEQLNFSINSGRIKPRFIDPAKAELQECAAKLMDFYMEAPALQLTRGEVENSANALVQRRTMSICSSDENASTNSMTRLSSSVKTSPPESSTSRTSGLALT
jgi:hypothetical protein